MLFKKFLSSFSILFTLFFIITATVRVDTFASSTTIESNFLDPYAVWLNKSEEETNFNTNPKLNTFYNQAPFRVTVENVSNERNYQYLISTGRYDTGTSPHRFIFGTNATNLNSYYNLNYNSLLNPFQSLPTTTYASVLVLHENLIYSKVDLLEYTYEGGSNSDEYLITPILSMNNGLTWSKSNQNQAFTSGAATVTLSFTLLGFQAIYLRVGFLFEVTKNGGLSSDVIMYNPKISITSATMTDQEQADQFASEIEDYSPCATESNKMIQITTFKRDEFIDKYNRLSSNAKTLLNSIPMGVGFTAFDRYQYLINTN